MTDRELYMLSALRYALGRKTYIVGAVCNQIRREVAEGHISLRAVRQAIQEIYDAERHPLRGLGHECDVKEWYRLRDWLKEIEYCMIEGQFKPESS